MTPKWLLVEGEESIPVGKILAVGRNYADHVAEMKSPAEPVVFMKPVTAVRLPGEEVVLPRDRGSVHHEIELVVSLCEGGSHLSEEDARRAVGAYGLGLDLTLRDVQDRAKAKGGPWTLAKGFDGSLPLSPFLPAESIADPDALRFRLSVNGEPRQEGCASDMLLSIPAIIAFISTWITLEPGDLILTGTPAGVGPVEPGDEARLVLEDHFEMRVSFC